MFYLSSFAAVISESTLEVKRHERRLDVRRKGRSWIE